VSRLDELANHLRHRSRRLPLEHDRTNVQISSLSYRLRPPLVHTYDPSKRTKPSLTRNMGEKTPIHTESLIRRASEPVSSSKPNNEWPRTCPACLHRRTANLLQVLGCRSSCTRTHLDWIAVLTRRRAVGSDVSCCWCRLGQFEEIGNLKGHPVRIFTFHWGPTD